MKHVKTLPWDTALSGGLKAFIRSNEPVIVEGMRDFPPLRWSVDELERRYGDIHIRVITSNTQYFSYDEKRERAVVQMPLAEFIEWGIRRVGADGQYYALGRSPAAQFPGLLDEIVLPKPLRQLQQGVGRLLEKNLWMSPGGTRTALHFDTVENFNIQVEGQKSFLLFPPSIQGMYPHRLNSQASYVSPVDPRYPDLARFPDFPIQKASEAVLSPGSMLYLPYGWWHQVNTTGDRNVNVNYWWLPRLKLLRYWRQSLRGAIVVAHRRGKHPHERAEKMLKNDRAD